jgi:hypothetical protein
VIDAARIKSLLDANRGNVDPADLIDVLVSAVNEETERVVKQVVLDPEWRHLSIEQRIAKILGKPIPVPE